MSLEGTHGLILRGSPDTRLESPFLNEIDLLPEQRGVLNLDTRPTQRRYVAGLIDRGAP